MDTDDYGESTPATHYSEPALDALANLQSKISDEELSCELEIILSSEDKPRPKNPNEQAHPDDGFWRYYSITVINKMLFDKTTVPIAQTFYHERRGVPHPNVDPLGDIEALEAINTCLEYIGPLDYNERDVVRTDDTFGMFFNTRLREGVKICDAVTIIEWNRQELIAKEMDISPPSPSFIITETFPAPGKDTVQ